MRSSDTKEIRWNNRVAEGLEAEECEKNSASDNPERITEADATRRLGHGKG